MTHTDCRYEIPLTSNKSQLDGRLLPDRRRKCGYKLAGVFQDFEKAGAKAFLGVKAVFAVKRKEINL